MSKPFVVFVLLASSMFFMGVSSAGAINEMNEELEEGEWNLVPVESQLGEHEQVNKKGENKRTHLTDEQVEELEQMASDLFIKRKAYIDKLVEFNVLTKAEGEKIKLHLDQHFQKMKERNFVPSFEKQHKRRETERK